jgi:hypothetical protein
MPPKKDTKETAALREPFSSQGPPSVRAQDVGVGAAVAVVASFLLGPEAFAVETIPPEVSVAGGVIVTFILKSLRLD